MKNWIITLAFSFIGSLMQALGLPTLCQIAVAVGKAFGPDGCRHFTELSAEEQAAVLARAPSLRSNHTDFPGGFKWVPRTLTTYVMPSDQPPVIVYGTGTVDDIPEPGTFVATRGYFALTSATKFHIRFGFRWDYNTRTLDFPSVTAKQLK